MERFIVRTLSHFDGETYHKKSEGPYDIVIEGGRITAVGKASAETAADIETAFLMPGLVEAHAHIFLNGAETDFDRRREYLNADFETMMTVARTNVALSRDAGITLIRDAGDRYGINDAIRAEMKADQWAAVTLRSPGLGIKQPKGYGGFIARDIRPDEDPGAVVEDMADTADDIKVILTGMINFDAGEVRGPPQFKLEEIETIIAAAHRRGRRTFAHCSGVAGLEVAVDAGVDSIEHGFFMTRGILERIADKGIAWVPTFSPVHFQWARPDLAGWSAATICKLRRILDAHLEYVAMADRLGVELVAGSDAGSPGVPHGRALIDEIFHFLAAGLSMTAALQSATSRPRRLWNAAPAGVVRGHRAELVALERSPFEDSSALRGPIICIATNDPNLPLPWANPDAAPCLAPSTRQEARETRN